MGKREDPVAPPVQPGSRPTLAGHLAICRVDHWIKNVFVLPGVVLAYAMTTRKFEPADLVEVALALVSVSLVASANYTINEVLDAPFDRQHPEKRSRPVPSGRVSVPLAWIQWFVLLGAGLGLGYRNGVALLVTLIVFACMGLLYNVRPFRTKDIPLLDVTTEAINNPLRLVAGWYAVLGAGILPPLSIMLSYWLVGCYFMALKRFAELRFFAATKDDPVAYRRSFGWYDETKLLTSVMFYAASSMLFFGAFLMRYRMELVLSFPLVAWTMAAYMQISFRTQSAARKPEALWREVGLMAAVCTTAVAMVALLLMDIPWLEGYFVMPEEVRRAQ